MNLFAVTFCQFAAVVAGIGFLPGLASAQGKGKPIKIEKSWAGEVKIEMQKQAPKTCYIGDAKAWEELWKSYRGKEELPKIDFAKQIVLVIVGRDPNKISLLPSLDDKGDLKISIVSTLIGFSNPQTCAYQFALISRDGIKSIRGKALDSK